MSKKKNFFSKKDGLPLDNIVSEWKFEDNVLDTVGSNDGTNVGVAYEAGLVGKTGKFLDSNDYVRISDSNDLSFGDGAGNDVPFSISCLIKIISLDGSNGIWIVNKREDTSAGNEWQLLINSGNLVYSSMNYNSGLNNISSTYAFSPTLSQWYHIALTYDGSKSHSGIQLYVDGAAVGTTATAGSYVGMSNTVSDVIIGARGWDIGAGTTNHRTDCVRIWDIELTQTDVVTLSTAELAGTDINP